jgi:hypothetical protein
MEVGEIPSAAAVELIALLFDLIQLYTAELTAGARRVFCVIS